jgi:hypothetical protein
VPLAPYLRSGYLKSGRTIEELARVCGIDPAGLKRTIEEYNRHARNGEDPAFGRGSTPYNRDGGDPDRKPNPCVAPIERGPFYAVKVLPGSFGTFAGLVTDAHTRVLNEDGDPIPGTSRRRCRHVERDGWLLPGRWNQYRSSHDLRLYRRPAHRGSNGL